MRTILRKIKSYLAINFSFDKLYSTQSFSQEGEDLIIQKYFSGNESGFYVDIGAHHPYRYSNTHLLYKKGWRGINIDPTPGTKKLFDKTRPKDINLEIGVSNKKNISTFFIFEDSAFNTFSDKRAKIVIKSGQSKLKSKNRIETKPLKELLKVNMEEDQHIDLMNIDVEGFELEVLKSNDWRIYRPESIVIENVESESDEIHGLLSNKGYKLIAKTTLSEIYTRIDFK